MATKRKSPEIEYAQRKEELSAKNKLIRRPIPRLDASIVRDTVSRRGKPKKFTPATMRNGINRYFKWCEDNDEMPSIKGLMIHLKTYKDQFYTYLKYPEFTDMLEHTRLIIANWAETDVYNTPGMAAGKVAYMKNLHGWADKIDTNSTVTKIDLTPEQARAKIEHLAPKLLEVLGNHQTLMQLTKRDEKIVEAEVAA